MITETEPEPAEWRRAIAVGAEHVVVLPTAAGWLAERIVDVMAGSGRAAVVGVVGARGGAGATTLACALAGTAAGLGHDVMLLDADPLGGGLDLVFGAEEFDGLRWPDLGELRGRLRPGLLRQDLVEVDGVRLLPWGRQGGHAVAAAAAAVIAAARTESDLVVIDLPRRWDPAAQTAARACGCLLLVVPAEVRAVAAAQALLPRLGDAGVPVRLVVRGPAPTGLAAESIADLLGLPLAASLRAEPGLAVALDRGLAPPTRARGPLQTGCRRLVRDLVGDLAAGAAR